MRSWSNVLSTVLIFPSDEDSKLTGVEMITVRHSSGRPENVSVQDLLDVYGGRILITGVR